MACLCALLIAAPGAHADGDPASDVLASQSLFVPADAGFAAPQVARLSAMLATAARQGVPVRVALIAAPADLGSVGELWRKPQSYADFLDQELTQVYRGSVVVVMPDGVGVARPGGRPAGAAGVAPTGPGSLLSTAMAVVQAITTAAGHPVFPPPPAATRGEGSAVGSVDLGSWLALAAGAALVAAAWTASLRARPPARLRRTR